MSYVVKKSSGSLFKTLLLLTSVALIAMFVYELNQRVNRPVTAEITASRDDSAFFRALDYVTSKQAVAPQNRTLNLRETYTDSEEIYYWIDDNGSRHYSDTPVEYAEKITLVPNLVHLSE